jgi:hypothetical protein
MRLPPAKMGGAQPPHPPSPQAYMRFFTRRPTPDSMPGVDLHATPPSSAPSNAAARPAASRSCLPCPGPSCKPCSPEERTARPAPRPPAPGPLTRPAVRPRPQRPPPGRPAAGLQRRRVHVQACRRHRGLNRPPAPARGTRAPTARRKGCPLDISPPDTWSVHLDEAVLFSSRVARTSQGEQPAGAAAFRSLPVFPGAAGLI